MFFMYADESGDPGVTNSPSQYFVLSGLVIHELNWKPYLERLIAFRQGLRIQYDLQMREEIHAAHLIKHPGPLVRIGSGDRLAIIRSFADTLAAMPEFRLINVVVNKATKSDNYDVFTVAWQALIQRFENTISYHNFPGPWKQDERGLIFCDNTDGKKLRDLIRKMRKYNPIPNQSQFGSGYRDMKLNYIIEDTITRDSKDSYFIQAADLCAYLLYQFHAPNRRMKEKGGNNYFKRLDPILCKVASSAPWGIVQR